MILVRPSDILAQPPPPPIIIAEHAVNIADLQRRTVILEAAVVKTADSLAQIEADLSLMRGVGVGLGLIVVVLQLAQSLLKIKT